MPAFREIAFALKKEHAMIAIWHHLAKVRVRIRRRRLESGERTDIRGISPGQSIPHLCPDRDLRMTHCQRMPDGIVQERFIWAMTARLIRSIVFHLSPISFH